MKLIQHVQRAVNTTVHKTSAALRLGAGVTGDVVATGTAIVGGTVTITGAVVAAAGFATYAGGCAIMRQAGKLADASQKLTDKAYDDLVAPVPVMAEQAPQEQAPDAPAFEGGLTPAAA